MSLQYCAFLLFVLVVVRARTRIDPLVSTDVGLIRGLRADDGDYSMFLGVPFGKIDENNPFARSTPYPAFESTYEAYDDSKVCPQEEEFNRTVIGSLDCLNLNIYVPNTASSINTKSVLVWIHGGGFRNGFNSRYLAGPKFLVQHDIILVTVNYRIGVYGFMCLDTPDIPGNQGLKDQLLALRWVNRNIAAFGADPNKVTIFGESAGAISVDMHIHSNNEKLYNQAIIQSGTAFMPFFHEPLLTAPQVLSEYLGFSTDSQVKALDFLATVHTDLVIEAVENLRIGARFRPCIEKQFDDTESVLTNNWLTSKLPKIKNMPILIGFNDDEWVWPYLREDDDYYRRLTIVQDSLALGFDVNDSKFQGMEEIVHRFYFGDEQVSAAVKQGFADFEADVKFLHPTYRSIEKYIDNEAGNIFFYLFSYVGQRNFLRYKNNITNQSGASHADELGYLFDMSYMKDIQRTTEDQFIIDQMTKMWTNFVKFGNPTPETETSENLLAHWEPVTDKGELPCMIIGSQIKLGTRPFTQRLTFWDLFYKMNEHLQHVYPGAKVEL